MYFGSFDCPIGAWVHHYPGMQNPILTGPMFRLLLASWQQSPAGTMPDDNSWLARVCAMPLPQFESVKDELMAGFVRNGIRWTVPELVDKAQQLEEYHGDGFARLSASATAAVIEPEHFALQTVDVEKTVKKRKKAIPAGFSITPSLASWGINAVRQHAVANGAARTVTEDEAMGVMRTVLEQFRQHALAKDYRYQDWDQAFQLFTTNQFNGTYGRIANYLPELFPMVVTPVVSMAATPPAGHKGFRAGNRREALVAGNASALDEALGMIQGSGRAAVNNPIDNDTIDLDMPLKMRSA